MNQDSDIKDQGLRKLIKYSKEMFRIPENTEYYSEEHYKLAEKKFVKYCVFGRKC